MRRKGDYVSLEDINTIWNDILKNHKIVIKTGVKYRHREEADTYYSSMDSLFFVNSLRVKEYKTGVLDEFTFQGHYKLTFPAVFNHAPKKFMLLMFLGIIFLAGLLSSGYFIVERSNLNISDIIPPPKPEEAEYLRIKKANCYPLNEMVTFDVDRGMLFTEDGREVLLKPLMVQLFMEFVLSPYYYALNTDLWNKLWDREEDPSNVLTQLISRTREEIDLIEEVEIRNVPRNGYRMVVYSKGEPRTKESEELRQETVKKKKNKPSSKRVR
ncbi:MAG: hypothetical protein LUG98_08550 [Tannerellaceae bacterium]|nr:hypothetical protein [Tannerellaceae bacterium]